MHCPHAGYVTQILTDLGYRATQVTEKQFGMGLYDEKTRPMNVEFEPWAPDFPSPSQYFTPILACGSVVPGSEYNPVWTQQCNPTFDGLAQEAQSRRATDPGAAQRAWESLYKKVDEDADLSPTRRTSRTTLSRRGSATTRSRP